MTHLLLLAAAAGLAYMVLALVKPQRPCGRCKGTPGRSKRYLGLAGPAGKCRRCSGKRRHRRRGAQLVHRFAWLVVAAVRERRQDRAEPGA